MAIRDKTIAVNNRAVHFLEDGNPEQGLPIILLHGGFGDAWTNWAETLSDISRQGHYVIAPDLPGFGQSRGLTSMRCEALIQWLDDFLNAMNLKETALIGHSFGGLIARLYASKYQFRIPTLILINGGVLPVVPALAKIIAGAPGVGGLIFDRFGKSSTSKNNLEGLISDQTILTDQFLSTVQQNSPALGKLMRGLTLSNITPEKSNPNIPVLLLWGEDDTFSPLKTGNYVHRTIPGSQMVPVANCGHLPHLEASSVFLTQLELFVKGYSKIDYS